MENVKEKEIGLWEDNPISSNGKFYLNEIIKDDLYDRWFAKSETPKIFILNKGRTGNGGTTGFINYARRNGKGLIVSVPNRSIVISKENESREKGHTGCGFAYGGSESNLNNALIKICTWDKTEETSWVNLGLDLIDIDEFMITDFKSFNSPLMVVDEYHKLIEDSNFRPICTNIVKTIIESKNNVVLMSATPNYEFVEFLKDASGKEVVVYNVEYDEEVSVPLVWLKRGKQKLFDIVKEIMRTANEKADIGLVNQVLFFYNNVEGINHIISKMSDEDKLDVEHLCSKDNKKKALLYSEKFNPEKKFHFLTSAHLVGMDVYSYVDKIIFFGGNNTIPAPFSYKDIKQGLGRPRKPYYGNIIPDENEEMDDDMKEAMKKVRKTYSKAYIIHNGMCLNDDLYGVLSADKEVAEEFINDVKESNSVKLKRSDAYIKAFLTYLYCKNKMESMMGWNDGASFQKMMSVYPEYTVEIEEIKQTESFKKRKDISFNKYKEKRLKGEVVSSYRYSAMCEKFIELCGIDKFKNMTRNEIERYIKINDKMKDLSIDNLDGKQKYDLLLGNGYYKGSYLMDVLKYLGEAPMVDGVLNYDMLEEAINKVFGCFCVFDRGDLTKKRSCLYLCVMVEDWETYGKSPKSGTKNSALLYSSLSPILGKNRKKVSLTENRKTTIRVSKKISKPNQKTQCITDLLLHTTLYSLLDDGTEIQTEFFTKILDTPSLIPDIKKNEKWKQLFDEYKKLQSLISEFYKDAPTTLKYPHKKDEMEQIDSIIVDIDDSITYKEFAEIYSDYEYIAYPSISNPDPDNWRKFRVIFTLKNTILIPNDSLAVLKLLRRMVCKYEDKNHQLGSYINQEQWGERIDHDGTPIEISQSMITFLHTLIKSLKTHTHKFKRCENGQFTVAGYWSMEEAISYYEKLIPDPEEGKRYFGLYAIKNRLSEEDCEIFADWLSENHPDKVIAFRNHKRDLVK